MEIENYKNRAPDVFIIEDSVIKTVHPRILLLTLKRLNYLFNKYDKFTRALIDYKRQQGTEFTLRLLSYKDDGILALGAQGRCEIDLCGIALGGCLSNYSDTLYMNKKGHAKGDFAPCDDDKLIEYIITHEFGHAVESLYVTKKYNIDWKKIGSIRGLGIIDIAKNCLSGSEFYDTVVLIARDGNSLAHTIKRVCGSDEISRYGSIGSSEFFAEAFACAECSSKVNRIGRTCQNVITAWFND